nr:hypothetical protein BaRGS_008702 [Batillaria attramentaria]
MRSRHHKRVVSVLGRSVFDDDRYVEGDPYRDILSDPNFVPKPEQDPGDKTIDQLIREAYGGLPSKYPKYLKNG